MQVPFIRNIAMNFNEHFGVPAHLTGQARRAVLREKIGEGMGSLLGTVGAAWLAFRLTGFAYAYVPFLVSSLILSLHFYRKKQGYMTVQYLVFVGINSGGVYSWLFHQT